MNFRRKQRKLSFSTPPALAALMLGCCAAAHAAGDEQIVPDRPGLAESSQVVGKGRFQVEAGFARERDGNAPQVLHTSTTPVLLRYGVGDSVELRAETDGHVHAWAAGAGGERGYADTALGLKWHFADAHANAPSLAILAHADLPSGSAQLRGQGVRPSLRVAAEWELPADWSLGVMPGIASATTDDGRRFTEGMFGLAVGKAWTERWHGFAELSMARIARARDGGSQLGVDAGMTYLLTDTCQADFAVGRGLNRRTPDLSWTVGLSFKM